eukprot:2889889-Alexandrium_andersonii.AAC.1
MANRHGGHLRARLGQRVRKDPCAPRNAPPPSRPTPPDAYPLRHKVPGRQLRVYVGAKGRSGLQGCIGHALSY